jgi:hypothetical protein
MLALAMPYAGRIQGEFLTGQRPRHMTRQLRIPRNRRQRSRPRALIGDILTIADA